MSLTPLHTFTDTSLSASVLNAEFNHIAWYFGNLTNGDLDIAATTPYPYVIAVEGTPVNEQVAAAVAAGRYLYLPAGSYTIEPDDLPAGTRIVGAGADLVTIVVDNSAAASNIITLGADSDPYDVLIKGVTIAMALGAGSNVNLIRIQCAVSARNIRFEDVKFSSTASGTRIFLYMVGVGEGSDVVIERCEFSGAIQVALLLNTAYVTFDRCRFIDSALGIVHSTASYSGTEGLLTVSRCYYEINGDLTGELYLDRVRARALYENNMFVVNDGTGLTGIVLFSHEGPGAKIFENNMAIRAEDAAEMYWVDANADHVVLDFNRFEGSPWNGDAIPFFVRSDGSPTALGAQFSNNLNLHIDILNQFVDNDGAAASRRFQFPQVDKRYFPYAGYDRGSLLTWDDIVFSIEEHTIGSNVNKLVLHRFDEVSGQIVASAEAEMDGTTDIFD